MSGKGTRGGLAPSLLRWPQVYMQSTLQLPSIMNKGQVALPTPRLSGLRMLFLRAALIVFAQFHLSGLGQERRNRGITTRVDLNTELHWSGTQDRHALTQTHSTQNPREDWPHPHPPPGSTADPHLSQPFKTKIVFHLFKKENE